MNDFEFLDYQQDVDDTAVTYENLPNGKTVITCDDGEQILVWWEDDTLREETIKSPSKSLTSH